MPSTKRNSKHWMGQLVGSSLALMGFLSERNAGGDIGDEPKRDFAAVKHVLSMAVKMLMAVTPPMSKLVGSSLTLLDFLSWRRGWG